MKTPLPFWFKRRLSIAPKGIKYSFVGGVNTVIDLVLFAFLYYLTPMGLIWSNVLAYIAALFNGYTMNKVVTFRDKSKGKRAIRRGALFIGVSLIGLAISTGSVYVFDMFMPAILAKLASFGTGFIWTYFGSHWFVFDPTKPMKDQPLPPL